MSLVRHIRKPRLARMAARLVLAALSLGGMSACGRSVKFIPPSLPNIKLGAVNLAWDGSFDSPGHLDPQVTGYRVYWGLTSRDYKAAVDAGNALTVKVPNLPLTTVYFAATAYTSSGLESDFSDEVSTIVTSSGVVSIAMGEASRGKPQIARAEASR